MDPESPPSPRKMKWECRSRLFLSRPCSEHCQVVMEKHPAACLYVPDWQVWVPVEEEDRDATF